MTNNNSMLSYILKYKEIYFLVPAIIYVIGFLCLQGSFSAINGDTLMSDLAFPLYPFNFEVYLYKGLFISLGLLLPFICLAFPVVRFFINKFNSPFKKGFYIVLASFWFHGITLFFYQMTKNYLSDHLNELHLLIYFFIYFSLFIYIFLCAKSYRRGQRRLILFTSSIFLIISLCTHVYWLGQLTQANKIASFIDGKKVRTMHIETEKGTYDMLIYDINKELATGIDRNKNIVTIPMDKINSMEIKN
ncbi:hypothetical protein [Paenibacillus xylanexedens]|uniref:hypothetical protein n=1 Tax=Paenibacillus TaxID=44249 RepID=UPI00093874A4|nr:hypothetical protein [Paenibacillus xylanexedens]APO44601.1 hypothetical protein BS614_11730 [Paenibacillus xylanexedens]